MQNNAVQHWYDLHNDDVVIFGYLFEIQRGHTAVLFKQNGRFFVEDSEIKSSINLLSKINECLRNLHNFEK